MTQGELPIYFTENGKSVQGNSLFEVNSGGALCNGLAMLTKLEHKTAFIGKVDEDLFGRQLRNAIMEVGIDVSYLRIDEHVHTTLAMVHTYPGGDRDFSYYRNPGADMRRIQLRLQVPGILSVDVYCIIFVSMV